MPRWRTRIHAALTSWPSPAFTPSRWPTLARPFFELEPAVLWAIDQASLFGLRLEGLWSVLARAAGFFAAAFALALASAPGFVPALAAFAGFEVVLASA